MNCRTCRFASIMKQECRKNPPVAVLVPTPAGAGVMGIFPAIDTSTAWCSAYEPADAEEMARRDAEHPVTVREGA